MFDETIESNFKRNKGKLIVDEIEENNLLL
jgi:hypothetical protein